MTVAAGDAICAVCYATSDDKIYTLSSDGKTCNLLSETSNTGDKLYGCKLTTSDGSACKECWGDFDANTSNKWNVSRKSWTLKETDRAKRTQGTCYLNKGACSVNNCVVLKDKLVPASDEDFKLETLKCRTCSTNFDINTGFGNCDSYGTGNDGSGAASIDR